MRGLMMDTPLTIGSIARHVELYHGEREIVSVTADAPPVRTCWRDCMRRARRVANAMQTLGAKPGDTVATLAWNDHRHLEIYYGLSGAGYVCHTINPRLFAEQIVFIVNHAADRWIFIDSMFVPLIEKLKGQLDGVEGFIVMTDEAHMPDSSLDGLLCYETLLADASAELDWPEFDENTAAALCYTSGTTGDPKGVLYSHRSTVLHAYASVAPDALDLRSRDNVLPVVPLFHVNAWGIPYSAAMVGAKLVLPGPKMGDGKTLCHLIRSEEVSIALGVPTVWSALLQYCDDAAQTLDRLERTVIGGAAVPRSMVQAFRDRHDVVVIQGWGMTEMSPLGTVNTLKAGLEGLSPDDKLDLATKAGRAMFGCELRIVDDEGRELPRDGVAFGALQVRGPWVCNDYYKLEGSAGTHTHDGWFETGDVATIDPEGYVAITDRTKDVIKSGGEWISSIELENTAVGHESVAEAAVIGVPHPKWSERPLLIVVPAPGAEPDKSELLAWFDGKVASWWIPNDVAFVDELPHTATGKIKKIELRRQFADYAFPHE